MENKEIQVSLFSAMGNRNKLSGPLLDRIDLQIEVPALSAEDLQQASDGESSTMVRARVTLARQRQQLRQNKPNARLSTREVDRHCPLSPEGTALLKQVMSRFGMSARAYHRVLRVARTIADLADSAEITSQHVAEAVQYRRFRID
jgi:magnesium chelatase family protein